MTELLVGTKKGLVVLRGEPGGPFEVAARAFPGEVVEFATRDPRSGRYFAGVTHGQFGPHLFFADDPQLTRHLLDTACDFADAVQSFRLAFAPDARVWSTIQ